MDTEDNKIKNLTQIKNEVITFYNNVINDFNNIKNNENAINNTLSNFVINNKQISENVYGLGIV